jgi:glycerophosphoryl diester phosphodiesterase
MMSDRSPWLDRRVIAYAHQGGAWESPSSTLFAIEQALAAGATGIELDVHATADGELVVCHDATVDRTTPATGNIAAFTLAELRQLDFSFWFIPGAVCLMSRFKTTPGNCSRTSRKVAMPNRGSSGARPRYG